ncbi:MAG: hypothetical protein ACIAZJ_10445 [Gimesia chilikensis]|uniref:hypothetical protein n=1 Tax=Gimesia chilikensis TaxID=2605989 RepID=UPI0037AFE7EB
MKYRLQFLQTIDNLNGVLGQRAQLNLISSKGELTITLGKNAQIQSYSRGKLSPVIV